MYQRYFIDTFPEKCQRYGQRYLQLLLLLLLLQLFGIKSQKANNFGVNKGT